jgi:hypothetical protein
MVKQLTATAISTQPQLDAQLRGGNASKTVMLHQVQTRCANDTELNATKPQQALKHDVTQRC